MNNFIPNLTSENINTEIDKMSYRSEPEVKIIADSYYESDYNQTRLTTFQIECWRPLMPHLVRHRKHSYCCSSSRAKPYDKIVSEIRSEVWGPEEFTENCPGMCPNKALESQGQVLMKNLWKYIAYSNIVLSGLMKCTGNVHKEIINRTLEPYSKCSMVIASTNFDNFFKLRCSEKAQAGTAAIANKMKALLDNNKPKVLKYGEWHLPYISDEEFEAHPIMDLVQASAARCARVSYKAFDGSTDIEKDKQLCQQLISNKEFSPLEFPAKANNKIQYGNYDLGFMQYRAIVAQK